MKGKLYKESEGYYLSVSNKTIGTTRPLLNFDIIEYKLSLENCQTIERGYDLDELADFYSKSTLFVSDEVPTEKQIEDAEHISEIAFKEGFRKALELMDNKKFSEDDVINIAEYVRVASQSSPSVRTKYLLAEYQSQEQTEWDVEIETVPALSNNGNVYYGDIPKLDTDGSLILKRI